MISHVAANGNRTRHRQPKTKALANHPPDMSHAAKEPVNRAKSCPVSRFGIPIFPRGLLSEASLRLLNSFHNDTPSRVTRAK